MAKQTIQQLCDERATLFARMKEINDLADKEARDLTAEETNEWQNLESRLDECTQEIDKAKAEDERRAKFASYEAELSRSRNRTVISDPPADPPVQEKSLIDQLAEHMAAGSTYQQAIKSIAQDTQVSEAAQHKRRLFRQYLATGRISQEMAALQMDSDTGGGSLTIPEEFVARLINGLDETVAIRGVATVLPMTTADSLGVPSLETDPADADWTVEIATGSADTAMATGKRQLHPHPLAKSIRVSKTLLRRGAIPVDALVRARLQFKLAVTEEKGFLTGTGAMQPLGLFTASNDGIGTARDYSTDNTTTAFTADGLIGAKYNLASQYHMSPGLRWVFHRDSISMARKLKDGNGQYLWQHGLAGDRPNTLLDVPYIVSEFAPNTFTTGLYVGIIGDMSFYWIAESLAMTVEVANELYMATNEDGYFIRAEVDGMPVLAEAFSRVTLA